jgi:hypothetical protein
MMTTLEKARFVEHVLGEMRDNPGSSGEIVYRYDGGISAVGTLPAWRGLPDPAERLTDLIYSAMGLGNRDMDRAEFRLHREEASGWLLLSWNLDGYRNWEWLPAMTRSQAWEHARGIRDDRADEYSVVRCPEPPAAMSRRDAVNQRCFEFGRPALTEAEAEALERVLHETANMDGIGHPADSAKEWEPEGWRG